jgi:uncharacterized protein YlzI (FlbEa/FlbD family)
MSSGRRTLALTLGAFLLLAAACGDGDTTTSEGELETTPDATLVDGEEVTVSGTVDDVLDVIAGTVFTLIDATIEDGTVDTEGEVAVVSEGDADVSESEEVVVTGTLFDASDDVQELEDLFGANVDDEMLAFLNGQQVIIASSVQEGV